MRQRLALIEILGVGGRDASEAAKASASEACRKRSS